MERRCGCRKKWPNLLCDTMQGGEVLWKKHIDHIKPLIFASSSSSSLPQVIPSQAAQHGEPSHYLPCSPDLPPVKLTNPGQDTTEGAAAPAKTTLTQSAVPSSWQTSTPNSAECMLLYQWWYLIIPTHLAKWKEILLLHHHHLRILLL